MSWHFSHLIRFGPLKGGKQRANLVISQIQYWLVSADRQGETLWFGWWARVKTAEHTVG